MSEWSQIDVFVAGLSIGLLVSGLFGYWAIRAYIAGVREGFQNRMRLERFRERPAGPPPPPADEDPGKVVKSG